MAGGEVRQLVAMVQQTLEATKSFIFDVRPMVLDDLGLVPDPPPRRPRTRPPGRASRSTSSRWARIGACRWTSRAACSGSLDEALAAYLSARAERVSIRLDWSEQVEARVSASRAAAEVRPDLTPGCRRPTRTCRRPSRR